ncbi:hypothetical protein JRO89_XS15G0184200 [Xanthoceras sorbifolium]|uniref:Disease resistance RPP13-like protein 1 n=1 Tax=Xanthoceras sorbifolium TaxID=99658 RepID=A0ABQ8H2W8_9ROSI|nr:hypothetical protein JRO89_XS15G0184200 [Xanthoceras sorbifolium]
MAEFVVSPVLSVLFAKLLSPELHNFATREGVLSKLKKWEKTLKMIDALLIDAEEKNLTNGAVKMWLDELLDLAYDAEDILDEYATEALRRKLKMEEHQGSTSRARKLIPACCFGFTPSSLWSDFSMRSKIDDVTSRLDDLCKQRTELGLVEIAGRRSNTSQQRLPTTCLPIEPVVYGRDEDRAKILEMVLRHDEPSGVNFGVIPIVGMGGIGKTTLAQQVYNDKKVEDFNPKAWVCVSDDFDVLRISKAILELITFSSCDVKEYGAVQNRLKDALNGKKFLIILDDVWSRSYESWESLKAPFMVGAPGSKIIVTTRSTEVALTMRPHERYDLKLLSDDDCWSMFAKHAFNIRGNSAHWNLDMIRETVVQKCKGLPLAAKTLGGLLYYKETEDEWMDILNSKVWDLKANILPVLRLSYYHLPSHLKRCFAYCAILPKDYEFEVKEIGSNGAYSIKEMPMGIGKWENLRTLSNFIVGIDSKSSLKDLKHLKFLRGELHISRLENVIDFEDMDVILSDKIDIKVLLLEWGYLFDYSQDEVPEKVLLMLRPHRNLEELTITCYEGSKFPSWVGDRSFSKMTVLKLEDCKKCTSLPSLGVLGSLKSLTIKGMMGIKSIGSEFYGEHCSNPFQSLVTLSFETLEEWEVWDPVIENESFPKLQELSIVNCPKLSKRLPNNLSSLKKLVIYRCQLVVSLSNMPRLCELNIDGCKKIVCSGLSYYESLESMSLSNTSEFGDWPRQEFRKVQSLTIEGCEELIEQWQNEIFLEKPLQGLHSLTSLRELNFKHCNTLTTLLEGIKQKNAHVEELRIESACGMMIMRILVLLHRHLPVALKHLKIDRCSELTALLPKGQLPETLETLYIDYCEKLESIVEKFHNNKALYEISIFGCRKLKSLPEGLETLSSLRSMQIINCGGFASFPNGGFPDSNLRVRLCGTDKLQALPSAIQSLSSLVLIDCPNMSLSVEGLPTNLVSLSIHGLHQYKPLTEWGLHNLISLRELDISGEPDGESFQGEDMRITLPVTLTKLEIKDTMLMLLDLSNPDLFNSVDA